MEGPERDRPRGPDRPRRDDRRGHRSRSRSPANRGDYSRRRSRSPRRHSPSPRTRRRSYSRSVSPADRRDRDRDRDTHERRRSRSPSRERERRQDKDRDGDGDRERRRRSRSRSKSRSSSSSSDEEEERERERRHRRKKDKHHRKRSDSRSRERDRDRDRKEKKKKSKKDKKKHKSGAVGHHQWGKYGIINETDLYNKEQEFRAWLVEERKINPETITKDQTKKEFARFAEDYNTATLPHEKFYNMDEYERRMSALRAGEYVPPADDGYDPTADMRAHASTHKRRAIEHDSYMNKEQLMELRKVQNERIQAGKMKLLGMEIKQNMGVRMDGTMFDG
ncbi:hypothetical protein GSI_04276 [Ganoderma sinense ZZ0214-1]|uniref:Uncharacterized protein n=1 Tax=Ganoderma sinense ZZ0214-1 TaxID=1077348 RepID=A0A2G8SIQ1_9APHY|nr:hypothetical protein GSI_04276 [Ganoderma sinense ZZ0214-1]